MKDIIDQDGEEYTLDEYEAKLMKETGVTREEWFMETDPDDPPFQVGDKVNIKSMSGDIPAEYFHILREPQEVESLIPVPCSDGSIWSVDLVDVPFIFNQEDLEKVE